MILKFLKAFGLTVALGIGGCSVMAWVVSSLDEQTAENRAVGGGGITIPFPVAPVPSWRVARADVGRLAVSMEFGDVRSVIGLPSTCSWDRGLLICIWSNPDGSSLKTGWRAKTVGAYRLEAFEGSGLPVVTP